MKLSPSSHSPEITLWPPFLPDLACYIMAGFPLAFAGFTEVPKYLKPHLFVHDLVAWRQSSSLYNSKIFWVFLISWSDLHSTILKADRKGSRNEHHHSQENIWPVSKRPFSLLPSERLRENAKLSEIMLINLKSLYTSPVKSVFPCLEFL